MAEMLLMVESLFFVVVFVAGFGGGRFFYRGTNYHQLILTDLTLSRQNIDGRIIASQHIIDATNINQPSPLTDYS
jgi:hypothetical protein